MSNEDTTSLQAQWSTMYRKTLPDLARSKSPSQAHWLVRLDHCFARVILDAVVGRGENAQSVALADSEHGRQTLGPWTHKLQSPATRHMDDEQLQQCVDLGQAIADGSVDLVELDNRSLNFRGKSKPGAANLKRSHQTEKDVPRKAIRQSSAAKQGDKPIRLQGDIRRAFGASETQSPEPVTAGPKLKAKIQASDLTEYRKTVLLALCQIPEGQVASYLAMSNFLKSSPRAVGSALRNNPYAPEAPCHRIIAADRGIGGFGGSWGVNGEHYAEKVRLLRQEGVRINEKEGKVQGPIWSNFK